MTNDEMIVSTLTLLWMQPGLRAQTGNNTGSSPSGWIRITIRTAQLTVYGREKAVS